MTSRRRFLKNASLSAAALAAAPVALAAPGEGAPPAPPLADASPAASGLVAASPARPRRIIFLVSDGMSTGVPSLAEEFSRLVRGRPTHFRALLSDPAAARGFFETHSLNSLVTDSAAAASAWGSGVRVFNGAINALPDGTKLTPILPLVKERGAGTGLVTTARITHATPAGFAVSQSDRGDEGEIAPQYRDVVDVLLGGGQEFYDPAQRKDGADLYAEFAAAGYYVARDRDALVAAPRAGRILGAFWPAHLPYTIDQMNSPEIARAVPTLAEMTEHALALLESNPQGFLLQVEGARVDHAAHANDAAGILWDQLAFDDAVGVALAFQQRHPDTLVVVTSDHGNSNPGLNGMGSAYVESTECFRRLAAAKGSVEEVENRFRAIEGGPTPEQAREVVEALLGVAASPDDAALVADAAARRPVAEINAQHRRLVGILGQVVGNHTGIGWTGTTHTEDFTLLAAKGPGQGDWSGVLKNSDAFALMADAFGVTHRNAAMSAEDAAAAVVAGRTGHADARAARGVRRPDWA